MTLLQDAESRLVHASVGLENRKVGYTTSASYSGKIASEQWSRLVRTARSTEAFVVASPPNLFDENATGESRWHFCLRNIRRLRRFLQRSGQVVSTTAR
jgi:hypothetical protein